MDLTTFIDQFGFVIGISLGVIVAALAIARNLLRRRER